MKRFALMLRTELIQKEEEKNQCRKQEVTKLTKLRYFKGGNFSKTLYLLPFKIYNFKDINCFLRFYKVPREKEVDISRIYTAINL